MLFDQQKQISLSIFFLYLILEVQVHITRHPKSNKAYGIKFVGQFQHSLGCSGNAGGVGGD